MESTLNTSDSDDYASSNSSRTPIVKAPKRWTLDQLEQKKGYSSSRDLQRDIRRIYSSKQGHDSLITTFQKTRRQRQQLSKGSKDVSLQKKTTPRCSKKTKTLVINLNPSSLEWRMGELVLNSSLGHHLLEVGRTTILRCALTRTDFTKLWDSFRELPVLEITSIPSLEMGKIWFHTFLAAGALKTWHSGIIGQAALTNAPRQRFGESLLDLRSCGIARRGTVYSLVDKCLSVALEASVMKEPTTKNLEIISLLVCAFMDFKTLRSRTSLLELGINHVKYLSSTIQDKEERLFIFKKFFDIYYTADVLYHNEIEDSGLPSFTVEQLKEILRDTDVEPMSYVDPEVFFTTPFPDNPIDLAEMYGRQGYSMLYSICVLRDHVLKLDISQIELENACSRLVLVQQKIRQSRDTVFSRVLSPSSPENFRDTGSLTYFTSVLGPEDIYNSYTLRSEESLSVFYLYNLVERLTNRFEGSEIFPSLFHQLEEMMDEQIKLNLELWEFILNHFEKTNEIILSSDFSYFSTIIQVFQHLPRGWRYLSKWKRKFPDYTHHLTKVIAMWKYVSFGKTEYFYNISEYEDEEQIYITQSPCADDPLFGLALDQLPLENISTPERIPSPDLSDFQQTLSYQNTVI